MYLLDTNICIALLKENPQAVNKFNRYFSQCYLSTITESAADITDEEINPPSFIP